MNSIRLIVLGAGLFFGCAGAKTTPETPITTDTDSPAQGDAIDEVIAQCNRVQNSDLPVSCKLDVVNNTARMQVIVSSQEAGDEMLKGVIATLAKPFCDAANRESQPAGVVLAAYQDRLMRVADCSEESFSDWQPLDAEVRQMGSVVQACEAIKKSRYAVDCDLGEVDGGLALLISYARGAVTEDGLAAIAQRIASPFCSASNSSELPAAVTFIEDNRRGRSVNCATGADTGWKRLQVPAPAPQQGPAPVRHRRIYHLLPEASASL